MSDPSEANQGISAGLVDEATEWFARLEISGLEQPKLDEFHNWLAADVRHAEALALVRRTWGALDTRDIYPPAAANDIAPESATSAYTASRGYKTSPLPRIAAAIAAVFALIFVLMTIPISTGDGGLRTRVTTGIGEHRVVDLPDGSQIELNTGSVVEIAFSDSVRAVTLHGGEAYFDVAHDPDRPFMVETRAGLIRAVGTAFNVYVDEAHVKVIVAEGIVEVGESGNQAASSPAIVQLVAGQQADIGDAGPAAAIVETAMAERQLAWRDGMLLFDGETLDEVLVEVSRYTPHRVTIADDELRAIRIGGGFRTGDVAPLITFLAERFDVRAERVSPNETRLHSGSG